MPFLQVFFAIWWAWINFTWFASSYDTDDVPYRLLTMVQMAGVLVIAAGVPAAARARRLSRGGTRLPDHAARARRPVAAGRRPRTRRVAAYALRYAVGISIAAGRLDPAARARRGRAAVRRLSAARSSWRSSSWSWPSRCGRSGRGPRTWHPHHIAERSGLFTIILLGESVLAASTGVDRALGRAGRASPASSVAVVGLGLVVRPLVAVLPAPAGDGLGRRTAIARTCGATATTASSPPWPRSAPASRWRSSTPATTSPPRRSPSAMPSRSRSACSSSWCGRSTPRSSRGRCAGRRRLLGGGLVILLLPLAARWITFSAVVAAIAVTCASIVAITILGEQQRQAVTRVSRSCTSRTTAAPSPTAVAQRLSEPSARRRRRRRRAPSSRAPRSRRRRRR